MDNTVREYRTANGLSQENAAELCWVTVGCWRNWEAGRRRMPDWAVYILDTKVRAIKLLREDGKTDPNVRRIIDRLGITLPDEAKKKPGLGWTKEIMVKPPVVAPKPPVATAKPAAPVQVKPIDTGPALGEL